MVVLAIVCVALAHPLTQQPQCNGLGCGGMWGPTMNFSSHPPPPPEAQFLQLPSRQTGDIDKIRRFQNGQKPRDCTSLTSRRVSLTL